MERIGGEPYVFAAAANGIRPSGRVIFHCSGVKNAAHIRVPLEYSDRSLSSRRFTLTTEEDHRVRTERQENRSQVSNHR